MSRDFSDVFTSQSRRIAEASLHAIKERPLTAVGVVVGLTVFPVAVGGVGVAMLGGAIGVPGWLIGSGIGAALGLRADEKRKSRRSTEDHQNETATD